VYVRCTRLRLVALRFYVVVCFTFVTVVVRLRLFVWCYVAFVAVTHCDFTYVCVTFDRYVALRIVAFALRLRYVYVYVVAVVICITLRWLFTLPCCVVVVTHVALIWYVAFVRCYYVARYVVVACYVVDRCTFVYVALRCWAFTRFVVTRYVV